MKMRKSNNATSFEVDLDSDDFQQDALNAFGGNEDDNLNEEDELNQEELDANPSNDSDQDDSNEDDDSLEDETLEDEGDESQEDDSNEDDDNGGEEDVKTKQTPSKKSPVQKQFGERANKRIRDLNARAKQAEEYANKIAQEADAAKKERYESEKARVEMQKELLEIKQERLKTQYVNASQDGDYEKQAEAAAELSKIGTQLAAIEGVSAKYKGEYKPEPRQQLQVQPDFDLQKANQLATDFEFENPRMIADQAYKATATRIAEGLMTRGFKPDTEEFYTELSSRMNKAFGNSSTNEASGKTQGQPQAKVVAKKPAPQAVSGASRTPAPQSGNNTNSKNSVRLSQEQIGEAQRLGQDLKTYARNQQKINESIKNKGRVSVYLEDL